MFVHTLPILSVRQEDYVINKLTNRLEIKEMFCYRIYNDDDKKRVYVRLFGGCLYFVYIIVYVYNTHVSIIMKRNEKVVRSSIGGQYVSPLP